MTLNSGKYIGDDRSKSGLENFLAVLLHTVTSPYFWIISGVLILSVAVGYIASTRRVEYALVLASVPLAGLIVWNLQYRLHLAAIILMASAAFTNFYLSTGTESVIVDGLALTSLFVAIWIIRSLIINKRIELTPYPVNRPLLGFIFTVPISIVWSIAFRDPFVNTWDTFIFVQIATGIVMIMLPASFLIIGNFVRDIKTLKIIVGMLIVAGFLGLLWDHRISPMYVNTNGLFTMWVVGVSIGMAIYNRRMPVVLRGLLLLLGGVWIYYRFGQNISWMAGWLPSFSLLCVLLFMRSKKLIIILFLVLLVLLTINFEFYMSEFEREKAESGNTRLAAWSLNWSITSQHILFGTGPGGYAAYLMSYYPRHGMATHSNYIDLIAQLGIVGLAFYLWFFARLALMGYKLCKRLRGRFDFTEALANIAFAGTLGCIVSMAFGDWLIPFPYTQSIGSFDYINYSWILMGSILVLDRLTRNDSSSNAEVVKATS
jgi:hypothetical protein